MKAKRKTKAQINNEYNDATMRTALTLGLLQDIPFSTGKPYFNEKAFFLYTSSGRLEQATEEMVKFYKSAQEFLRKREGKLTFAEELELL